MLNICQLQFGAGKMGLGKPAEGPQINGKAPDFRLPIVNWIANLIRFRTVLFVDDIQSTEELIEAFHAWLGSFDAVDDQTEMLNRLSRCLTPIPPDLCRSLGLPSGSSYAAAADLFLSLWTNIE